MRLTIAALTIAVGLVIGVAAQAPQQSAQERRTLRTDEKVTMIFTNADVIDVLNFIDRQSELEIRISPDVKNGRPINLRVQDADLAEVFKTIIEQADLDYEVLDDKTARVMLRRR